MKRIEFLKVNEIRDLSRNLKGGFQAEVDPNIFKGAVPTVCYDFISLAVIIKGVGEFLNIRRICVCFKFLSLGRVHQGITQKILNN